MLKVGGLECRHCIFPHHVSFMCLLGVAIDIAHADELMYAITMVTMHDADADILRSRSRCVYVCVCTYNG